MADAVREKVEDASPSDALRDAGQRLLGLLVQRAADAASDRVANLSDRLTGVAENGGQGLRDAVSPDGDGGGGVGGVLSKGLGAVKEKVKAAVGGGGGSGGGKKLKVTVISEDIDVGLPLRTTYDLWTQFGDFPSFMKKVESVEQESDEKTNWKAQVLWSHRTWEATIVEQVPDSHIVWRSTGAKGYVDGAVGFTELGPNLTRIMMVLEYHPQGMFEYTGNLWRAQGRRARLEFQHFRRHAMSHVLIRQDEVEGWRGEIRDGEVVTTHEDALDEERRAEEAGAEEAGTEEAGTEEAGTEEAGTEEAAPEDEYDEEEADEADHGDEVGEEEYPDEEDDYAEEEDEYTDEEADEEPDEESREPVTASRSRRKG